VVAGKLPASARAGEVALGGFGDAWWRLLLLRLDEVKIT
jgi:hypothetical protein